ncbi:MAG: FAD-dependent oxidoreductase [Candidatus Riflebacteria bacterium]|nr:FAD-dependent oxidoreductase [Candidatus Riflebacteria bacterium]
MKDYDVVVVGAGIVGCSIAWRLSRTNLRIALIEKGSDVANGATRANSGILHSGIHEEPDSEVFAMCQTGTDWYREWSSRLDFPLQNKATVILAHNKNSRQLLEKMAAAHAQTLQSEMLDQKATHARWPFLADSICGALVVENSAQILPYDACRAILENAVSNDLTFLPDCSINQAEDSEGKWVLTTTAGLISSRYVIIAAGAGSNEVSRFFALEASYQKLVSGAYYMLARNIQPELAEIFFTPPSETTKGIVLQQTIHGNLMLGPDAIASKDLTDEKLNWNRFCSLWNACQDIVPQLDRKEIIRTFTGERVNVGTGFQFDDHLAMKRVLRIDGVKSPGLTAAPAIAMKTEQMLKEYLNLPAKNSLVETRISIVGAVAEQHPGELVCRCEKVFMSQIAEAIRRGADNIETIRWQTRAGMGDCQGSFCRPRLTAILRKTLNLATSDVKHKNQGSQMFTGDLK